MIRWVLDGPPASDVRAWRLADLRDILPCPLLNREVTSAERRDCDGRSPSSTLTLMSRARGNWPSWAVWRGTGRTAPGDGRNGSNGTPRGTMATER